MPGQVGRQVLEVCGKVERRKEGGWGGREEEGSEKDRKRWVPQLVQVATATIAGNRQSWKPEKDHPPPPPYYFSYFSTTPRTFFTMFDCNGHYQHTSS